jgi:hypothetical protein
MICFNMQDYKRQKTWFRIWERMGINGLKQYKMELKGTKRHIRDYFDILSTADGRGKYG